MTVAGALDTRVTFQARETDANGDATGAWVDRFTVWAALAWLRGSEAATASRIEGRQPVQLEIRASSQALAVTNGWRAVVAGGPRAGAVLNITAVAPARTPGYLNLQAVAGGPAG